MLLSNLVKNPNLFYNNTLRTITRNIQIYNLEKKNTNYDECIDLRRKHYEENYNLNLKDLPKKNYNYKSIINKNCENVIGYVRLPVGIVGPININNKERLIPISTTEGALVGSINRGASFIKKTSDNGISSITIDKGITRSPIIDVQKICNIPELHDYLKKNYENLKNIFESTTNHGKLKDINILHNGTNIHLRISATTGDAMGMNIISKGSNKIVDKILEEFPEYKLISLSGNTCTDKKPSAINWINGRGKTVIANCELDIDKFENIIKFPVENLVKLNIQKNLIGSALAGSIGGFNSHAANIVAGIYLATGQDIAQIGTSSVCLTDYTIIDNKLNISITMPSLELATIGGGTDLEDQVQCLNIMGIDKKQNSELPGNNSLLLSKIVASTVLCGELSLMCALCVNNLVDSHMKFNRGII